MKNLKEQLEFLLELKKEARVNKSIALILSIAFAIVVVLYMDREVRVIYGPPKALEKPIEITNPKALDIEWARFYAQVLLNFTPFDLERKKKLLLPYIAPEFRSKFEAVMDETAKDANKFGIYQLFQEEKILVGKNGEVVIEGLVRRYISGKDPEDRKVKVYLVVKGGKLYDFKVSYINSFNE
jgi:hypothetical protein